VDNIELGQLCLGGQLANDFARGGDCYQAFSRLRQEGLVRRFVLEVFPWTSDVALKALRGGYPDGIVAGYIFYLNPLQRFASNELWDLIRKRNEPVIALRTVSGGNVHRLRDVSRRRVEGVPAEAGGGRWLQSLNAPASRAGRSSACACHSFPQVRATVGATSRPENLREFLSAKDNLQPLPGDIPG